MSFRKFANAQVLDYYSTPNRVKNASLRKTSEFKEYLTDDGFIYMRVRAISSRTNRNNDSWPSEELKKAYKTFLGKPVFVDHHNSDPKKARGVIVDAAIHVEDEHYASFDPYYASAPKEHLPPTWIELLMEIDAKQYPKLAKAIISGDIDGVSVGADVEFTRCSHCDHIAYSPDDFCKHILSKGAYFDFVNPDGTKTSKKSYEHCHGIHFFEESIVFEPADETALKIGDVKTAKRQQMISAIVKEGDRGNPPPQAEMTVAPDKVNTLENDRICPICGSDMNEGSCNVCNYQEPPEGFDNPDLEKAKEIDQQMRQQDDQQQAQGQGDAPNNLELQNDPGSMGGGVGSGGGMGGQAMSSYRVIVDDGDPVFVAVSPKSVFTSNVPITQTLKSEKVAAVPQPGVRVNVQERPLLPNSRQLTDKALNQKTIKNPQKVQSNNMANTKVADGATAQGEGVQAQDRVDVLGVGGFGADPLSGIDHENVEKDTGNFTGPHTDTWSGKEGDSLGQHEPVTDEVFEGAPGRGDAASGATEPLPVHSKFVIADSVDDLGGPIGEGLGTENSETGVSTDSPSASGFPDHDPTRVELAGPLKEEIGAGTMTWSGDGAAGNGDSLGQKEPVTTDGNANNLGGPIGVAVASAKRQLMKAMKLADVEVEMGIIPETDKFDRVSELENEPEVSIDAQLNTLSKVRTAGLKKQNTQSKTAGAHRMPSFKPITSAFDPTDHAVSDITFEDSLY